MMQHDLLAGRERLEPGESLPFLAFRFPTCREELLTRHLRHRRAVGPRLVNRVHHVGELELFGEHGHGTMRQAAAKKSRVGLRGEHHDDASGRGQRADERDRHDVTEVEVEEHDGAPQPAHQRRQVLQLERRRNGDVAVVTAQEVGHGLGEDAMIVDDHDGCSARLPHGLINLDDDNAPLRRPEWTMVGRRRVLFAVEPLLYESALSDLVRSADVDVFSHRSPDALPGSYDVAIVTGDLPAGVAVDVEIRLPAAEHGTGEMTLRSRGGSRTIPVHGLGHILAAIKRVLDPDRHER
jgi:hypothetical protein